MLSLYIHFPWCEKKCPYCDFYSTPRPSTKESSPSSDYVEAWLLSVKKSLNAFYQIVPSETIQTIFFGGGTPSLMPPFALKRLLLFVETLWPIAPNAEISMEANPSSSEREAFGALREAGINRLSLGIQALDDTHLAFLGRTYRKKEAYQALETAGETFDNVSCDFIFGLETQSLKAWEKQLDEVLSSYPLSHLSLYELTIEEGTPFFKNKVQALSDEMGREFYELTLEKTKKAGFENYEVSNYAKDGKMCQHNLVYWTSGQWIGVGPSAHSRLDLPQGRSEFSFAPSVTEFLSFAQETGSLSIQEALGEKVLSVEAYTQEIILSGLRLTGGIPLSVLEEKTASKSQDVLNLEARERLIAEGLLTPSTNHLIPTKEGRLKLNYVIESLLIF